MTQSGGSIGGIYPFVFNKEQPGTSPMVLKGIGLRIAANAPATNQDAGIGASARRLGMETIQLAIADISYAAALRELLARDATWRVLNVKTPNPRLEGVMVLDAPALERLPSPMEKPERVVLITSNDPGQLARAWEAGIVSVVFENDSIDTAMLAIMATRLRVAKAVRGDGAGPPAAAGRPSSEAGLDGGRKKH
jgi:hypothetical protein